MPKFRILGRYGALLALISPMAWSGAPPVDDTALTIYSSARPGAIPPEYYRPLPGQGAPNASGVPGFAMVRHEREVQLAAGRTQLQFTDVAALIDPTTVTFTSLTEPGARVLEQNFQFDLVSTDKLLLKYIDRPVTVERSSGAPGGSVTGTLLSSADGLVLRGNDGAITALRDYSILRFPDLPGGLISRPTLQWDISATRAGAHRARVTYQTGGVTWWADYNLIYQDGKDAGNGFVDLSSWVSIINQSGAGYPEAKLKLIAGDVHRAPPPPPKMVMRAMEASADAGFQEQAFDEFHLYTLGRPTSLPNNSTKQIELFDQAHRVPAQRLLVFANGPGYFGGAAPYEDRNFPATGNTRVATYLQFRNDRASGLGVPLPAGRMRVSRLDAADNSLEFIGEDVIDHTPRDERVRVQLGSAFDVVGERKQVAFTNDSKARWMEEEVEVELRNHKDEAVEVQVRESLFRWSSWQILSSSAPYVKEDARTIVSTLRVAANGSAKFRYRVRYTW
jgi:hypothetical protein